MEIDGEVNLGFAVPHYVFESIVHYVELSAKGENRYEEWNNIKALLRLAISQKRLSTDQAKFLEEKYCRET